MKKEILFTTLFCLFLSSHSYAQETETYEAELVHAPFESDYLNVRINGHQYWVLFVAHDPMCPCKVE